MSAPFRVGYVPGVMPDTWQRRWSERSRRPLELVRVEVADQEPAIREGRVDMCLVRGPVDREGLHLIPLYEEVPVVVASREHPVAAYDEIALSELADEHHHQVPPLTPADAVAAVAAGTGIVVLPLSLARLHQRKDVVAVPLTDVATSPVGLSWLVEHDDPDLETFIGVVRGRSVRSSRGR
ncbi:MAG TPA: LysR substrate-binding domain-containing protein [Marmoricola sp.]|jgi:DNA-binding transcriptional LysR family regulator|nr:LysR substrate-binding domain-containing protein [Marmoricola sp.]